MYLRIVVLQFGAEKKPGSLRTGDRHLQVEVRLVGVDSQIGQLELAHQGTMFLDEVGDIALELQPKLLRVLQEKEFERLGSNQVISSDVRIVAATNRDLRKMVLSGQFRGDLFYRLDVFPIVVPLCASVVRIFHY
jgi:transcriptional regulator with GAF, ATPase, and Fis domain